MIDSGLKFSILTRSRDSDYVCLPKLGMEKGDSIEHCLRKLKIDSKRGVLGWINIQANIVVIWGEGDCPRLDKEGRSISIVLFIKLPANKDNHNQIFLKNLLSNRLDIINSLNRRFEKCFNKNDLNGELNGLYSFFEMNNFNAFDENIFKYKEYQFHSPLVKEDDLFILNEMSKSFSVQPSYSNLRDGGGGGNNSENTLPNQIKSPFFLGSMLVVSCLAFAAGQIFNLREEDTLKKKNEIEVELKNVKNNLAEVKDALKNKENNKPLYFSLDAKQKEIDFDKLKNLPQYGISSGSWKKDDKLVLYCNSPDYKLVDCNKELIKLEKFLVGQKHQVERKNQAEFLIIQKDFNQ